MQVRNIRFKKEIDNERKEIIMANYYTSDLHIGHGNCLNFDNRPFRDLVEMEEELIRRWNQKVRQEDTVYILGDIGYKVTIGHMNHFLSQLNGRKILIQGNHDYGLLHQQEPLVGFSEIHHLYQLRDQGYLVVLCHYPMLVWNQSHRGSIHLYGHVHECIMAQQRHPFLGCIPNAYNVGCMNWNYEPVCLQEILKTKID